MITDWLFTVLIISSMTAMCIVVNALLFKFHPVKFDFDKRKSTIDGLRGFLAVFVFIHHFIVWYFYISMGRWDIFDSNIFRSLGHTSVTIFFMITGYLFFTKIKNNKNIDWAKLLKSRVRRIAPLYFAVIISVFSIVAIKTNFHLKVTERELLVQISQWFFFTFPTAPNINNYGATSFIVAGVTWSLVYEWFFYFSLPLISYFMGGKVNLRYIAISIALVFIFIYSDQHKVHVLSFLMGCMASFNIRSKKLLTFIKGRSAGIAIILLIALPAAFFSETQSPAVILLSGLAFFGIAKGNNLFGLLSLRFSKMLGEISYSIYLVHGIVLFLIMPSLADHKGLILQPFVYLSIGVAISILLMIVTNTTYRVIEKRFY
ncbi:acyltransferase [Enterobacter kobei]|nr:acyltransferase [Enterobacter kobei]